MNTEMPPWNESIPTDWSNFPHSSYEYSSRLVASIHLNPGFIPGLPGKHFKSTKNKKIDMLIIIKKITNKIEKF